MPSGKEILDGIEFLKHGGPAAVIGLVVGYVLATPQDCGQPLSGPGYCHNLLGEQIPAFNGSAVSYEWITPIIGFVIVFAVAGWALGGLWRALNGDI